mgnify:CR=1 FL=1
MKTFIKYDFYIQILFLITGIVSVFIDESYIRGLSFYFLVGIPQIVSYIIKLFFDVEKSLIFFIYGFFIIPVWISLILYLLFGSYSYELSNLFIAIPFFGFFYSPILALLYIFDCYKLYKF